MEIWKDIKGYEGEYQASNLGRIKSLHFNIKNQNYETILKGQDVWNGYLRVTLSKKGRTKLFAVHRLVAQTFLENPKNLPVVNHINGDRTDNRIENLEWVTFKENSRRSAEVRKTDRYNSIKVKDNQGNTFNSYREAGRFWGLNPNTVKRDVLGKTKYSEQQKDTSYEREVRFMKGE